MTALAKTTREVYERQAEIYDRQRTRCLFEEAWLQRLAAHLPARAKVLDLGCGAGEPVAQWLMAQNYTVTGVDFAEPMLTIARKRWPKGDWRMADMRTLDLGETFNAVVAWNSFFHLTPDEQRQCLPRLTNHLQPGGWLLMTVGPDHGEGSGTVGGQAVYHASLSPADYATRLEENGMRLTAFLAEDPETNDHSVLLARKD